MFSFDLIQTRIRRASLSDKVREVSEDVVTQQEWIELFCRAHHEQLIQWALRCTRGDRPLSEELVSDLYVMMLQGKANHVAPDKRHVWAMSVLTRLAQTCLRTHLRRLTLWVKWGEVEQRCTRSAEDPSVIYEHALEHRAAEASILDAIESLPQRQREIIILVFYHELTISDAADVLSISVGSARTHYTRAKRALAKQLTQVEKS